MSEYYAFFLSGVRLPGELMIDRYIRTPDGPMEAVLMCEWAEEPYGLGDYVLSCSYRDRHGDARMTVLMARSLMPDSKAITEFARYLAGQLGLSLWLNLDGRQLVKDVCGIVNAADVTGNIRAR